MTEVEPRPHGGDAPAHEHEEAIVRRHPQLGLVLTAEGLSSTGDAVFWVGVLVWLLGQPNGTGLIALAAVARLGPRVVFGAAGGVVADRYDRRRLLVALDLARSLMMVALAFVVDTDGSTAVVLTLVFVTYVLATPYRPAFTAGIPFVVGERDASAANALDGAGDRSRRSSVRCSALRCCGSANRRGRSRSTRRRSPCRRSCWRGSCASAACLLRHARAASAGRCSRGEARSLPASARSCVSADCR